MNKVVRVFVLTGLLAAFAAVPAFGWDDVGHKITAYIAWQQMSDQTRERVIEILRRAPEDSHLSVLYRSYGAQPETARKREFFMVTATWPDIVRDRDFPVRFKTYHKGNWHYDDTFWRQVDGKMVIIENMPEGGEGLMRLVESERTLRDAAATDAAKALALAWFLHIGGDLHQPLHTSARITDLEPKGDQGGNTFLLTSADTPQRNRVNLHGYWDSIVSRKMPMPGEICDPDYIEPIAERMMKKYPATSFRDELEIGKYDLWQKMSFDLNPTDVFSADLTRGEMPSKKYLNNAYKVSERQFALAGYRMGKTLENIFGTPAEASSSNK